MRYLIRNHQGSQIIQGTFDECEEMRRHCLEIEMMKRFRLLSKIYDNRAGAIACRTAFDRTNELICMRRATVNRQDLAIVRKRIAYYRSARPVEIARKVA